MQNQSRASAIFTALRKKQKAIGLLLLLSVIYALPALAQSITVKGRVTNETNQPVVGASVMVKGTTNGTTTSDNGEYKYNHSAIGTNCQRIE